MPTRSSLLAFALGVAAALVVVVAIGVLLAAWWRRWVHRASLRAHRQFGARVDRYKFADRDGIVAAVLADAVVGEAVRTHAREQGVSEDDAWKHARGYVQEIVPQFSLWFYYRIGLAIAESLLKLFFRVRVIDRGAAEFAALPKDSIVVYLMNHRSNADYVLAGWALAGQVAISYAVGEWARVFPLDYVFKTFGAYFVRRRFREPLYHTVLERYVQLITANGVTQGIFPEGGLSRDGRFRPVKIGLLDYMLGVARDPAAAERMYIVPVAINYDRVLEDRSLLRELNPDAGHRPPNRLVQFSIVLWNITWNVSRIVTRSWKRHGDAVVVIGAPVPVAPRLKRLQADGIQLFELPREQRLGEVQKLADDAMRRIGDILPVTAVPIVCAAIQTFEGDYVPRARLLERVDQLRDSLADEGRVVVGADEPTDRVVERAVELLWSRRALSRTYEGIVVLKTGRELVSYYANSIVHLLGDFAESVRDRDALPVYKAVDL
ncbi:MAG: hypothetical protein FJ202_07165 [Gemmatimonadetes bacterium]|nr:hypothetical protein [Gemmatimonadota bacterium]